MISEFELWAFTGLTGIAAGLYMAAAVFPMRASEDKRPWLVPLAAVILLCIGGIAAMGHVGRPELLMNVLNNPGASLTMEGIFTGVVIAVAVVDLVLAAVKKRAFRAARIAGLVASAALIVIESYAYLETFGIPAWTSTSTFALFVLGDIAAGAALWLLMGGKRTTEKTYTVTLCVLAAAAAASEFWKMADFAAFGADGQALLAAGGAVTAVGAALAGIMAGKEKLAQSAGVRAAAFVLVVAGVVVARYGFYMASIL